MKEFRKLVNIWWSYEHMQLRNMLLPTTQCTACTLHTQFSQYNSAEMVLYSFCNETIAFTSFLHCYYCFFRPSFRAIVSAPGPGALVLFHCLHICSVILSFNCGMESINWTELNWTWRVLFTLLCLWTHLKDNEEQVLLSLLSIFQLLLFTLDAFFSRRHSVVIDWKVISSLQQTYSRSTSQLMCCLNSTATSRLTVT